MKTRDAKQIQASDLGIGCEVLDRDYASYAAYKEYLGALGVKNARFQSGWAKTEKVRGVYDFSWLDWVLDDCLSRGIQPWVNISYGNPIYPGGGTDQSSSKLPLEGEALQAWLKYVEQLASRYKDKVKEWEIWNESDHRNFRGATPEQYAAFFIATGKAIRSVQPQGLMVVGGLCSSGPSDYVRRVFEYIDKQGEMSLVHGITFHGYPNNPDATFGENVKLVAFVKKYGKDKVARQGETGAPSTKGTSGALTNADFTELSQAKWDLRRALGFTGNAIPFSLFTLSEFNYPGNRLNTKGKLKINDDLSVAYPKQSYFGYQNMCSLFDKDMAPVGRRDEAVQADKISSMYVFRDKQTGTYLFAYWYSGSKPGESLSVDKAVVDAGRKFKEPVLVDLRTGMIYEVPAAAFGKNGAMLPIYDAPLLLCEKKVLAAKGLLP